MSYFSEEYVEKLVAEHKLISATLNRLATDKVYVQTHGTAAYDGAISNLKTRKVELEAMIDTLKEYLNS